MTAKVSKPRRRVKRDFPLFKHANGQWCKKVKGVARYFGRVAPDPDGKAALEEWLRVRDDLLAGRTPRPKGPGPTLRDLVNRWLSYKEAKVETGELERRTWAGYHAVAALLLDKLGKDKPLTDIRPDDLQGLREQMGKGVGLLTLLHRIQVTRSMLRYAWEADLVAQPIRMGVDFKPPSAKALRRERATKPPKMFTAGQVHDLLSRATVPMAAMVYLGLNCMFGNSDVANLPTAAVDLKTGWVRFPRPKTGIPRRCKLWPETVGAVKEYLKVRPKPRLPEDEGVLFITKQRHRWVRFGRIDTEGDAKTDKQINSVGLEFGKLLGKMGLKNAGLGFYCLRHTGRTVGDEAKDRPAIDIIMGHQDANDMANSYREYVEDSRIEAVVSHVREWFLRGAPKAEK